MRIFIGIVFSLLTGSISAQVTEPYQPLHNGSYTGKRVAASPDPLVGYAWKNPLEKDSLQYYQLSPAKVSLQPYSSFLKNNNAITVNGKGDILLDFGTESAGWLEFESDDLQDTVTMSISEYNEPAILNAGAQNPVKTKKPVKYGNIYRLELNDQLYEGVRFAWIHVKEFSKSWHISNIKLVCQVKPVNYQGSFFCNDTMLNRIWYTGAYVVKLNMLQDFFGAILMERSDRHSWTGDAYPAQAAALAAFGNYDVIRKNIAFTSAQDNGIAAYSIYWVLGLIEYFNYTGDSAFFKAYASNAEQRLQTAHTHFDSLPSLGFMGWDERLGAGFEEPQTKECRQAYRMLCVNAFKKFADAMAKVGNTEAGEKFNRLAAEKIKWVKSEHSFGNYGVHAISEAVNAGLITEPEIATVARSAYNDRLNRLSYSPFNQYFILQAMILAGYKSSAITTIKDCWGGQITYGGTSFFEVYRPSWNTILQQNDAPPNNQCGYTSLAHPWGAGVTKWLSENVLGIQPVEPGFRKFIVKPYLDGKLNLVQGAMPTPYGLIKASFNSNSGICTVSIPKGTLAASIGLPKAGREIVKVMVNSKASSITIQDQDYVYLENLPAGIYEIAITYRGDIKPKLNEQGFHYLTDSFRQDSTTSGNWKASYGKDGVLLFGSTDALSKATIPSYIDTIIWKRNGTVTWSKTTTDARAPESISGTERVASAIITKDPVPTLQTMTIDVHAKTEKAYTLSLYFLDWDAKDRRSAVELFDLKTLNIIAPVQMIRNYEKGRYLSFTCKGSVRIRVNQVRGENAAVSALFFDQP